ncbi:DNA repair protein RecN [Bergeyella zoohelcum]|uniref:DNA repair protein RecN n=2 Tax=Bergeyella zoohelcum TaxID=1015 RepID=K1LR13_9FLAO|nr:DNA repair protein RecN [Bergeyella zoohelcum]EKB59425.1 DNA repair protein RecN [Bergeyella zoohelcum ATCC 43767]EKB60900.1 DNA repair protein RecN [Bergeyella zoohelcum CCUG 30536]SSZ47008.1 Recombination protein N [Bergeyella zoohelcum]SUV49463.1 Recombination protein N [Bergeyella zoohelcum]
MLNRIFIQNFALIEHLDIDLHSGLQVITGETGAGKSIILGALRLILGERADVKSVVKEDKKSIVEVQFSVSPSMKSLFEALDLDFEEETIIRRELLPNGKSRAFINDVPTTLEQLRKVSEKLIDIHSQFETAKIFTEEFQFNIIDGIAKNEIEIDDYQYEYRSYLKLKSRLKELQEQLHKGNQERDYKNFLLTELQDAQLDDVHWETLQSTLSTQENAEFIAENLSYALGRLEAEEMGVLDGLSAILHRLQKLAEFSPQYAELVHRLDSSFLEIKDITNELQSETEKVEINPILIQELQKKVNLIQGLLVKHNTESVEQLIEIRNQMQSEQSGFENIEEEIAETQKDILIKEGLLNEKSLIISDKRKSAADVFKAKMEQLLQQLGLEKAKILAELTPSSDFHLLGKEHIKILFQANSGFEMKPIQQAISGGERSRVMLAVKKIMAENNQLPTLILDEIDTGVSGKVAEEIGMVMKDMAKDMQLIVISHLAQVAAKGTHHYKVQKFDVEGVTQSTIKPLSEEERLIEIAQLLSGSTITDAAVEQAKALMNKDA